MKLGRCLALLLLIAPLLGYAEKKKHTDAPAVFETAKSVYVEAEDGDYAKPGLSAADRQAIADVQDAMRTWNRYQLAVHREQADVVLVVRKGQPGNGDAGIGLSGSFRGSAQGTGAMPGPVSGQPGSPDSQSPGVQAGGVEDRLRIYAVDPNGKIVGPVWTRELPNGLDAPGVILVQQLKMAVERAYPAPPAAGKPAS